MTEHQITVERTARYFQAGELGPATRHLWFVCHGYGQLAAYFIRHFTFLADADPATVVVAPEGLSRFYLNGTGGRVGASWMTRDGRLSEIIDHTAFLEKLCEQLTANALPGLELNVLGFSQGTATVARWLAHSGRRPARLVLWAGGFPDDVADAPTQALLAGLPVTLVVGDADEYVSMEQLEALRTRLTALGAAVAVCQFASGHTLNREVLARLAS